MGNNAGKGLVVSQCQTAVYLISYITFWTKAGPLPPELAARFEVSPRTIYRDVEALSGAGIPVYAEPGRNGGISLLPGFTLDKAILSAHEQQEILAAVQSISATGYSSGEETLTKLSALFHVDMGNWLEVDFSRWGKIRLR